MNYNPMNIFVNKKSVFQLKNDWRIFFKEN